MQPANAVEGKASPSQPRTAIRERGPPRGGEWRRAGCRREFRTGADSSAYPAYLSPRAGARADRGVPAGGDGGHLLRLLVLSAQLRNTRPDTLADQRLSGRRLAAAHGFGAGGVDAAGLLGARPHQYPQQSKARWPARVFACIAAVDASSEPAALLGQMEPQRGQPLAYANRLSGDHLFLRLAVRVDLRRLPRRCDQARRGPAGHAAAGWRGCRPARGRGADLDVPGRRVQLRVRLRPRRQPDDDPAGQRDRPDPARARERQAGPAIPGCASALITLALPVR